MAEPTDPNAPALSHAPKPEPQTFSRDYVTELREEAKTWKQKAEEAATAASAARDEAKAAQTAAETRAAEREAAANQRVLNHGLRAAAIAAGIVDMDGIKLLDTSAVKLDEHGELVIPEGFFAAAKKAKPYLFAATGAQAGTTSNPGRVPAPADPTPKHARDMDAAEYKATLATLTRRTR